MIGHWEPLGLGPLAQSSGESRAPHLWRGLVGDWLFCAGRRGDRIPDLSARGSTAIATMTNMDGSDWQPSPLGWCLDFDGSNDYCAITTATAARLETTTGLTVFGVGMISGTWTARNFANRASSSPNPTGWGVGISDSISNKLKFYTGNSAGTGHNLDASTSLTSNVWYSFAWTYFPAASGTNKFIYVDGKIDGSAATTVTMGYTSAVSAIGRYEGGPSQYWPGKIALVKVWSRALAAGEILALHRDPLLMNRRRRATVGKAAGYNAALGCFDEPDISYPRAVYLGI